MTIDPKWLSSKMATDQELSDQVDNKVDKISPIQAGKYRNPVFTVNEQGQITSIREKITVFAENNTDEQNDTTTFKTYISLTVDVVQTTDYKVEFMAMFDHDFINSSPIIDVQLYGTGIYSPETASHEELKDFSNNERVLRSGFDIENLSVGSHTLELVYACESQGTMNMRYGSLRISEQ